MKKEFWMNDVTGLCSDACDFIQDKLKAFDLKLTDEQEDKIFNKCQEILEELSNGDYRGYN